MVHGLGAHMSEGIAPLVKNLFSGFEGAASQVDQKAKLAGARERAYPARAHGLLGERWRTPRRQLGSAFERLPFNGT